MGPRKRVCVIGAGTAGLSAIKNSLEHGLEVKCFEQSKEVGGTWIYSNYIGNAPYEDEIHSSMYDGLHTNLPKEVMGYPDFEFSKEINESFVSSEVVLNFLRSYADHFNLHPHISFSHSVIRVRPRKNDWEIIVCDLANNDYITSYFDFVFVCNGHYTKPETPDIEGMNIFAGLQLHSHVFRKSEHFRDQNVLIIGAGPSGMDITDHIGKVAKFVYLSHHLSPVPCTDFIKNVIHKPDVEHFTENGAVFKDGTVEFFSSVIYCTGYKYSFPFLSVETDIRVQENSVYPLYKHCININHPTMALIGLPYMTLPTQCFDLQVRFSLTFFIGKLQLPTQAEMEADLELEISERLAAGIPKRHFHSLGQRQYDYYKILSDLAGLKNIRPAIQEIMKDIRNKYITELGDYRQTRYRIIDDEKFIKY